MKAKSFAVLAGLMLLSSCKFFPAPEASTPFPTLPFTGLPAPATVTAVPIALQPVGTVSPVLFRDDFNLALASGWNWRGNDPASISISDMRGSLRLNATSAYAYDEGIASLLIRQAPDQDFQIETRLVFSPLDEYQFAGLIVYESPKAYLQAGRGYCRREPDCVKNGLYLDRFINSQLQAPRLSLAYGRGDTVFLRLERRGSVYTFYASPNNVVWQPIGERHSDIAPLYVGLFSGQNAQPEVPAAYFDFFQVSSLPVGIATPSSH